jgi:hypothetical protein
VVSDLRSRSVEGAVHHGSARLVVLIGDNADATWVRIVDFASLAWERCIPWIKVTCCKISSAAVGDKIARLSVRVPKHNVQENRTQRMLMVMNRGPSTCSNTAIGYISSPASFVSSVISVYQNLNTNRNMSCHRAKPGNIRSSDVGLLTSSSHLPSSCPYA